MADQDRVMHFVAQGSWLFIGGWVSHQLYRAVEWAPLAKTTLSTLGFEMDNQDTIKNAALTTLLSLPLLQKAKEPICTLADPAAFTGAYPICRPEDQPAIKLGSPLDLLLSLFTQLSLFISNGFSIDSINLATLIHWYITFSTFYSTLRWAYDSVRLTLLRRNDPANVHGPRPPVIDPFPVIDSLYNIATRLMGMLEEHGTQLTELYSEIPAIVEEIQGIFKSAFGFIAQLGRAQNAQESKIDGLEIEMQQNNTSTLEKMKQLIGVQEMHNAILETVKRDANKLQDDANQLQVDLKMESFRHDVAFGKHEKTLDQHDRKLKTLTSDLDAIVISSNDRNEKLKALDGKTGMLLHARDEHDAKLKTMKDQIASLNTVEKGPTSTAGEKNPLAIDAETISDVHLRLDGLERDVDQCNDEIDGINKQLDMIGELRIDERFGSLDREYKTASRDFNVTKAKVTEIETNLAVIEAGVKQAENTRDTSATKAEIDNLQQTLNSCARKDALTLFERDLKELKDQANSSASKIDLDAVCKEVARLTAAEASSSTATTPPDIDKLAVLQSSVEQIKQQLAKSTVNEDAVTSSNLSPLLDEVAKLNKNQEELDRKVAHLDTRVTSSDVIALPNTVDLTPLQAEINEIKNQLSQAEANTIGDSDKTNLTILDGKINEIREGLEHLNKQFANPTLKTEQIDQIKQEFLNTNGQLQEIKSAFEAEDMGGITEAMNKLKIAVHQSSQAIRYIEGFKPLYDRFAETTVQKVEALEATVRSLVQEIQQLRTSMDTNAADMDVVNSTRKQIDVLQKNLKNNAALVDAKVESILVRRGYLNSEDVRNVVKNCFKEREAQAAPMINAPASVVPPPGFISREELARDYVSRAELRQLIVQALDARAGQLPPVAAASADTDMMDQQPSTTFVPDTGA